MKEIGIPQKKAEAEQEIEQLKARLKETEEVIAAIQEGRVDALVTYDSLGGQVFTLKTADQGYRTLVESMGEGAVILSAMGDVYYCNRRFASLADRASEAVIGSPFFDYLMPEEQVRLQNLILQAGRSPLRFETRLRGKEGRGVPVLMTLNALDLEDFSGVGVLVMDLTEKIDAQKTIEESRNRYEALADSIGDVFVALDGGFRFIYWNRAAEELTGVSFSESIGRDVYILFPGFKGSSVEAHFLEVMKTRVQKNLTTDYEIKGKSGILEISAYPSTGGGIWILARDVTERQRRDEALRKSAAELSWRNRELQEFTSVASHDLQEPLRKIQAFGSMLENELGEGGTEAARDYLSRMIAAAARMQKLIRALLEYSRVSTKASPFKRVDLKKVAETVVEDIAVPAGREEPVVEIGDLPVIDADPIQISQLLQNLVANAIRYSKNGQVPVVTITSTAVRPVAGSPRTFCELHVKDNGIGFDMRYLENIFRPFERLHGRGEYEGTGMGLAICRKIAERHGGKITAKSQTGKGAVFIVQLPMRQYEEAAENVWTV